ncbi:MAG: hypothetical protein CMF50_03825 [Legionellales bacterium]|nr:hypothetical protein [Legionellales bacterium]|tara:strand:- start:2664 stop:3038 length:375 start_codon:yes stop_codon:yes gene_type:complete
MPVCRLELTDNISLSKPTLQKFFVELHQMMVELIDTSLESCKSYVSVAGTHCTADGNPRHGFAMLGIQILPGRDHDLQAKLKNRAGEMLVELLNQAEIDIRIQARVLITEVDLALYYMADVGGK